MTSLTDALREALHGAIDHELYLGLDEAMGEPVKRLIEGVFGAEDCLGKPLERQLCSLA